MAKRTSQTLTKRLEAKQAEIEHLQAELAAAKKREKELLGNVASISDLYKYVGCRLRDARESRNLTQGEVADAASLTRTSIVNLEGGTQRAPLHVLWSLCKFLGITWTDILPVIPNKTKTTLGH